MIINNIRYINAGVHLVRYTTRVGGVRVSDDRHLTMNFSTAAQQAGGKHFPSHVYLQEAPSYQVKRVKWYSEKLN